MKNAMAEKTVQSNEKFLRENKSISPDALDQKY